MLCEHGVFPHEVLELSYREMLIMNEFIKKDTKEKREAMRKK
jgi:hypothetical protein